MSSIVLTHLRRLTDDTGLIQHACYAVPRRDEGYSADDNARALILMAREAADAPGDERLVDLATVYLAYLEHAQDPQGAFRNFMTYDRRWAALPSSADCQGRCLWALAEAAASSLPECLRETAWQMLLTGVERPELTSHARTAAFYLLALEQAATVADDGRFNALAGAAADQLLDWFRMSSEGSWQWFEDTITYAAGRVPQAMLAAATMLNRDDLRDAALVALEFLIGETIGDDLFVPVGNQGWYPRGATKAEFDQQPIEAMAMVEVLLAAQRATGEPRYAHLAQVSGRWFTGSNVGHRPLADPERGSCYDGLEAEDVNRNQGAESTLAWLITQQALDTAGLSL
jgi:hypothetical protein